MPFHPLPEDTELNRMINDFERQRQSGTKAAAPSVRNDDLDRRVNDFLSRHPAPADANRKRMTGAELDHAVTNILAPFAQRQAYAAAKGQVETVRRPDGPIRIIQPAPKPKP